MEGIVIKFSQHTGNGKIRLKDGNELNFVQDEWNLDLRPIAGMKVDFKRGNITSLEDKRVQNNKSIQKDIKQDLYCKKLNKYIEEKISQGYSVLEKNADSFTLRKKYINEKLTSRAKRYFFYSSPLFFSFLAFIDFSMISREDMILYTEIAALSLFGVISTLAYEAYFTKRINVDIMGKCDSKSYIIDDSQEKSKLGLS